MTKNKHNKNNENQCNELNLAKDAARKAERQATHARKNDKRQLGARVTKAQPNSEKSSIKKWKAYLHQDRVDKNERAKATAQTLKMLTRGVSYTGARHSDHSSRHKLFDKSNKIINAAVPRKRSAPKK
jgi:hypothetical protein